MSDNIERLTSIAEAGDWWQVTDAAKAAAAELTALRSSLAEKDAEIERLKDDLALARHQLGEYQTQHEIVACDGAIKEAIQSRDGKINTLTAELARMRKDAEGIRIKAARWDECDRRVLLEWWNELDGSMVRKWRIELKGEATFADAIDAAIAEREGGTGE